MISLTCVNVHAIGKGNAFTSPTFFHNVVLGGAGPSWYAYNWQLAISSYVVLLMVMFHDNTMPVIDENTSTVTCICQW